MSYLVVEVKRYNRSDFTGTTLGRSQCPSCFTMMSNPVAHRTWREKYYATNDRVPPHIYEQLNASALVARPGETNPGQTLPRLPRENDFPKYIELRIIASNAPKEDIQYIIVVLHGYGADIFALEEFSKQHLLGPKTACVLVRGTNPLESQGTYCWSDKGDFVGGPDSKFRALQAQRSWTIRRTQTGFSSTSGSIIPGPSRSNTARTAIDSPDNADEDLEHNFQGDADTSEDAPSGPTFEQSTKQIGIDVIVEVLIKKCGFRARDIALVGHDQGGSAALAVAAGCWETKLGGVVTIGGRLPTDFPKDFPLEDRCPTHILVLGGRLGDVPDREVNRIESTFSDTTNAREPGKSDDFDDIKDAKLKEFLAHQLRREEWTKEAVISFGM